MPRGMANVTASRPDSRLREVGTPVSHALAAAQEEMWDVVVIGGGNAALVAALTARRAGARVLLLERSPRWMRGGNTRHTRNIRCVHRAGDAYNTGPYLEDELWRDLCAVGDGPSNERLARFTVQASETAPRLMSSFGVRWQPPLASTLHLDRTNRFFLGGGKALVNVYYRAAEAMGITAIYDSAVTGLEFDGLRCSALIAKSGASEFRLQARAVVCASGGFEANLDWLREYWGAAANNYIIRGTPYNDGRILRQLLDAGAATAGYQRGFHAIAVDARAPRFDGGIATRLDVVPFGIVVNKDGQRFYDEGEEIWPKRYATWGGLIGQQPDQIAFGIWDSKVSRLFLPPMYPPACAGSIGELAQQLGLDPAGVSSTVKLFNSAVLGDGLFDATRLDTCRTVGIAPPKSHWAQRLDTPPYYGIPMRPGVTFTYMGVEVDDNAHVVCADGSAFDNVFAAGEIMSGNILSTGYLAGFGLTIGTVWGRHAGDQAARYAR